MMQPSARPKTSEEEQAPVSLALSVPLLPQSEIHADASSDQTVLQNGQLEPLGSTAHEILDELQEGVDNTLTGRSHSEAFDHVNSYRPLEKASELAPSKPAAVIVGAPHNASKLSASATMRPPTMSRCPFNHGSVGIHPFPGYVHGKNPQICPNKCVPDPNLGKNESLKETLIREALEYQELFHHEKASPEALKVERRAVILASIAETGTYVHTFEELEHGARVAWRNAPKCANRKFAMELNLLDHRNASSPQAMEEACLDMLEKATVVGATETYMTVFRPAHPLRPEEGGPRVWNTQLLRFAGYRNEDMSVTGDPSEVAFTEMCMRNFGWQPPGGKGKGSRFDILPLVLQTGPYTAPQLFKVPKQYSVMIPFTHPRFPWFAELQLQWYGIPAVSNMEATIGGLLYTGIPFSGWYADVEICRNMADEGRYNMLPEIATRLGYSISNNATLWREAALTVLNEAIVHSFQVAGMGMVDKSTLMQGFWDYQAKEYKTRGYIPGNWKWMIPPIASATSACYLGLNKMTEYTIKPALLYAPGAKSYAKKWFGAKYGYSVPPMRPLVLSPIILAWLGRMRLKRNRQKMHAVLLYSTVSGTTKVFATKAASILGKEWGISVLDVASTDVAAVRWQTVDLAIFMTSTYGSGAPPASSTRLIKWLTTQGNLGAGKQVLAGKLAAVFGLGSTAYPRFCAAADSLHAQLLAAGAESVAPVGKGDACGNREDALIAWLASVTAACADRGLLPEACRRLQEHLTSGTSETLPFTRMYSCIKMAGLQRMAPEPSISQGVVKCSSEQLNGSALKGGLGGRSSKLIRMDISQSRIHYDPGDHIAVYATTYRFKEELEALGLALGLLPTSQYASGLDMPFDLEALDGSLEKKFALPNTFRKVLAEDCAMLDIVSRDAVAAFSQFASDPAEKAEMADLSADEGAFRSWSRHTQLQYLNLFSCWPSLAGSVPVDVYLQLVPTTHPRYYSIASSLDAFPGEVHILVGRAAFKLTDGTMRYGQCSDFLTTACQPGDSVRFKVARVATFRLPMNPRAPVVMVAAGTGLAPLRGFIQARTEAQKKGIIGPAILLFGCRSRAEMLCRKEIEEAVAGGTITRALVAYSRSPSKEPRRYVQDKVMEEAQWLRNILNSPDAHFYICGDSLMANAVASQLSTLLGPKAMANLTARGSFHEDVFGAQGATVADDASAAAELRDAQRGLLFAAAHGNKTTLMKLVEAGGDLLAKDDSGNTVLHLAVMGGHLAIVQTLLEMKDCPLNVVNAWGLSPRAVAAVKGRSTERHAIKKAGGKIVTAAQSFYPLHSSALIGDSEGIREMVAQGAITTALDWAGLTPLHLAAACGHVICVSVLLELGALPNTVDKEGHTPLAAALAWGHPKVVAVLKAAGAHITGDAPSAVTYNRAGGFSDAATALKLTPDVVATAQAMWSKVAAESWPEETRAELKKQGLRLFQVLFEMSPQLITLFPFKNSDGTPLEDAMGEHGLVVMKTVAGIISRLGDIPGLMPYLLDITVRHIKYGVEEMHFKLLSAALLETFQQIFGQQFGPSEKVVWSRVFGTIEYAAQVAYAEEREKNSKGKANK